MEPIDYMSRNPVGLAIPPSEYDENFVVASIGTFNNNMKMIDNVILANQNIAPYELIKKRAKKGLFKAAPNIQLTMKDTEHSATGHCQTNNKTQSHSKSAVNQSTLFRSKRPQYQRNRKNFVYKISFQGHNNAAMSRIDTKGFKGGFNPTGLRLPATRGRKKSTENWQGSSDSEETLSDPRWHKRPPTKGKKGYPEAQKSPSPQQEHTKQSATPVRDAREVLSTMKIDSTKKSNFPKITSTTTNTSGNRTDLITLGFNMKTTPTQTQSTTAAATTQISTSEPRNTTASTQTSGKSTVTNICVSSVDTNICIQEVQTHNIEPSIMGPTTLEASHQIIIEELVATVEKATNTVESEEDTPLFRQRL